MTQLNLISEKLIFGLQRIEKTKLELPLVPLNNKKQPLGDKWQNRPFMAEELIRAINNGGVEVPIKGIIKKIQPQGFGVITGKPITVNNQTHYLMALDQDGVGAAEKIKELSNGQKLPDTVAFTSKRPGRCQYLFLISEQQKNAIHTKKIKTGVIGDDGKEELLEFRFENLQSVLPPSIHPKTGQYYWLEGCAIDEIKIAIAPEWLISQMRRDLNSHHLNTELPLLNKFQLNSYHKNQANDIDYAISYLNALSSHRADNYDEWLTIGMALHNVDNSLLFEWEKWSRQSSKYKPGECQKKWNSFSPNGTITIATLGHLAKEDGWESLNVRSPFSATYSSSISHQTEKHLVGAGISGNMNNSFDHNNNYGKNNTDNKLNEPDRTPQKTMREMLNQILINHYSTPKLTEIFNGLSLSTGWNVREIRQLAQEIDETLEQEDSRSERFTELKQIEDYKKLQLDLCKYLPQSYAHPMTKMAKWMEIPNAGFLTGFLPLFASCLHPQTRIIVKECIGFVEPPIIYSGVVTESGQRKSPLINALADPLRQLQAEEEKRYLEEKKEYDEDYEEWLAQKETMPEYEWKDCEPNQPAPQREFFIDKVTMECIDKIKSQQPNTSLIWLKDELSGLFNSYNAYKKGKGDDKESVLSSWNGRGVKKNLKGGERVFLKYDSMSIFGAIQDVTLQKKMGSFDDEQGEWARFLWCLIPLKALRLPEKDSSFYLEFLKDLYENARSLTPKNYRFTNGAQRLYDNYHWNLEKRRVSHSQRGMRAAISKMEGYTARLALVLHLVWELEAQKTQISEYIPEERVQAAIGLTEFYLSQVNLIHTEGAASLGEGGLTPRLSAILTKLQQFQELTARKVQSTISWLRKVKASTIRQDFIELVKLGYGKLLGKGNRLKIVLNADSADISADISADKGSFPKSTDFKALEEEHLSSADIAALQLNTNNNENKDLIINKNSPNTKVKSIKNQHDSRLTSNGKGERDLTADLSTTPTISTTADLKHQKTEHDSQKDELFRLKNNQQSISADDSYDNNLINQKNVEDNLNQIINNQPFISDTDLSDNATKNISFKGKTQSLDTTSLTSSLSKHESSSNIDQPLIVNQLSLNSIILEAKVFIEIITKTLQVNKNEVEINPDYFSTLLFKSKGCHALAMILEKCQSKQALAVLRYVFPRALLLEASAYLSDYQKVWNRLKQLKNGILPPQSVYIYFGENKTVSSSTSYSTDETECLETGTLIITSSDLTSNNQLVNIQKLDVNSNLFQVKQEQLILLLE